MDKLELKQEVELRFLKLKRILSKDDAKYVHLNSIGNFIYHMFLDETPSNTKLFIVNLENSKIKVNEYLILIESSDFHKYTSKQLYVEYVESIGSFMHQHYGFSFSAGSYKVLYFLIYIVLGIAIGLITYVIISTSKLIILYCIVFLVIYAILRKYYKTNKRRIYGPNYWF